MHDFPSAHRRLRLTAALLLLAAVIVALVWLWLERPDVPVARSSAASPAAQVAAGRAGAAGRDYGEPDSEAPDSSPQRYAQEYPSIHYSDSAPTGPIAALERRLASGDVKLTYDASGRGWLDSLLAALDVDPSSQVLVFSQTSLQSRRIRPSRPRAIYFNDDVYVAWVQQGPIEIGAVDPALGAVFYLVEQAPAAAPTFGRQGTRCLNCHDSYSLSGGGVPRFIVGSGYVGSAGELVSHEGWILVTDETPLESRWGGWYVTGHSGDQAHLGNMIIRSYDDFKRLDQLRVENLDKLDALFDTKPYLTDKSDIVALLVLEHQVNAENAITRASWDTRTLLDADGATPPGEKPSAATLAKVRTAIEPLVRTLLFADAATYSAPIEGSPKFADQFERRAVRDAHGRSLRDLELTTRLFKYPLSYTIYSREFDALPPVVKRAIYERIEQVLRGEDRSEPFAALDADERAAIREILVATKPDFASTVAQR